MALLRHRNWYLENFIKENVHPDADVLVVGRDDVALSTTIRIILQKKGLQLRGKTGAPIIDVFAGYENKPTLDESSQLLSAFATDALDVVVFNWVPHVAIQLLEEARRISRQYVILQINFQDDMTTPESWRSLLEEIGHIDIDMALPKKATLDVPGKLHVLYVVAVNKFPELDKLLRTPSVFEKPPEQLNTPAARVGGDFYVALTAEPHPRYVTKVGVYKCSSLECYKYRDRNGTVKYCVAFDVLEGPVTGRLRLGSAHRETFDAMCDLPLTFWLTVELTERKGRPYHVYHWSADEPT